MSDEFVTLKCAACGFTEETNHPAPPRNAVELAAWALDHHWSPLWGVHSTKMLSSRYLQLHCSPRCANAQITKRGNLRKVVKKLGQAVACIGSSGPYFWDPTTSETWPVYTYLENLSWLWRKLYPRNKHQVSPEYLEYVLDFGSRYVYKELEPNTYYEINGLLIPEDHREKWLKPRYLRARKALLWFFVPNGSVREDGHTQRTQISRGGNCDADRVRYWAKEEAIRRGEDYRMVLLPPIGSGVDAGMVWEMPADFEIVRK